MIDVDHAKWTERGDLRDEWMAFTTTEVFKAGIEALESHIVPEPPPVNDPNPTALALASARKAGFADAIAMIRNLHLSVSKPMEPEPAPWEHLLKPKQDNSSDV